ncbi:mitochondrial antiviral-signaling protein [Microcaecilia unicolor]|uniref:Mitochondrial antiviral-signaling protein n=1 Tax=Microcaecilia unicolor TaxID=1415580 RepID=A0A6P7X9T9_9AMPH|nr:mitochondrial antiviral-signaling protein [Microcaecilia unicolor]XP_030046875.1 mitochondrial antiviral-signaling protein [Microcaecilia unicolor]
MGVVEEELEKYIRANMHKFRRIHVEELLPYLACLSQTDQEELRAHLNNKGNLLTVWHLLTNIQRRNGWPTNLINTLRTFEYTDLADELQHKYDSLIGRSHQNNTPVAPSAAATPPPAEATAVTAAATGAAKTDTHRSQQPSFDLFPQAPLQPMVASQQPDHLPFSSSDTENYSDPNNEYLDDLKIPIPETKQSPCEVQRTSETPKTEKVSAEDPPQNFASPAATAIKLRADEPVKNNKTKQEISLKQSEVIVDTPVSDQMSEEERSMNFSKPGVLASCLDEEEPYSGSSDSLQLSRSTAENTPGGENSSILGDTRNTYFQDQFQVSNSSDFTIRNDPLMISNSATDSLLPNFRVPRAGQPEENHYSYDSSSQILSRGNRNAILDNRDMNDPTREQIKYMAKGDTVDRHNERSLPNDGMNTEKRRNTDGMGRNYSNKSTSADSSLQPEGEKTTDPVENRLDSTDTSYHKFHFAEDPDIDLKMPNDRDSVPDLKDSVSTSSDTSRMENVPGENGKRTPVLSSTLLFMSILVAFSSVSAVLLWKCLRN